MSTEAFTSLVILFALAIAGVGDLLFRRDLYRCNATQEWRVREGWMRSWTSNEDLIIRSKRQFFKGKGLKMP